MRVIRGWSEVNLHIKLSYLEELSEFLDEVEALWCKRFLMLEADAEEILDKETKEEFYDFHQDRFYMLSETFPRVTKYNLLVSGFSFLEQNLIEYYTIALEKFSISQKVEKNGAYYYLKWFKENFDGLINQSLEKKFDDIRLLRNCIVHNSGKIEGGQFLSTRRVIENSSSLSLNHFNEIMINSEYVYESFEVISKILKKVHRYINMDASLLEG